jgi:hypothetical protein
MQSPHPVTTGSAAVDNWPGGVQPLHPEPGTGCNRHADGVQLAQSRGAAVAPEPSKKPCLEPSAAPGRVDEAPALDGQGGGPIGEFFAALGPGWRLTAAQRARLAAAVTAALKSGWTPGTLAAITGGEHQRSVEPVRGAGGAAGTRRAAPASHPAAVSAAVVRSMRRADPDDRV